MEELISSNEESNKKPLNIVLLGDESSEKEKLMSKFLLLNSPQFQENEAKNEEEKEEKEEDISIFHNIIHTIEIHGEKLKMKLWDNPSTEEFLSPSIKIAQGILLFYSVKNRKSYEKIQNDLSKIIELGRFDIPIIVIGNHKNSSEREVTYDEAKTWADNYGLRFYETSLEKDGSMKAILQDIAEQLSFQECIFSANNSVIIKDDGNDDGLNLEENLNIGFLIESKNKEEEKKEDKKPKTEKTKKRINSVTTLNVNDILGKNYSSNNIFDSGSDNKNINKKRKSNIINKQNSKNTLSKNNSSTNFKKIKPKINTNNTRDSKYNRDLYKTENNTQNKINTNSKEGNKITNFMSIINKTKNLFKKNSTNNLNKTSLLNHSKKKSVNTLNLSSSSTDIHSYLKKTALTKNREKEIKEKKIKIEKESQSITAQKEREGLELKKKKIIEDKENYLKKIKEDKILQKEKEKKKREEEIQSARNNYDKLKQEKELITQEKKLEKEKDKLNKIALKQSEKEKYNKKIEELNKEREKEMGNLKIKKEKEKEKNKDKNNISPNKHKRESTLFNLSINNKSKSESFNIINKTRKGSIKLNIDKDKEIKKEKEKELKEKITSIKIGNDYTEREKAKEDLKNSFINYQNTQDIYRCLKCNSIPKILFNENNQEIEILCDNFHTNISHYNIISYQNFQTKSVMNSLYENTFCYFCNKTLNKLEQNEMIYYCPICQFYFCSQDEKIHIKEKHQNENNIKDKYKLIISQKTNSKKKDNNELELYKKSNSQIFNGKSSLRGSFKQDLRKSMNKIQDEKATSQKKKELIKIPIYLLDTFCKCHDEIFNSYCYTCNKNICNRCIIGKHKGHNIENFENIMPNEEEINKKKSQLNLIKDNLSKINDYFTALIEAIKCRFERLYKAKQKEIEIKEKIIADYEKIKYNYNSIMNLKNLKLDNKQNFMCTANNKSWIERMNLIFEYLNCSLISENNNIFKDINENAKFISNKIYFNNNTIKNVFKMDDNNFALINAQNELKIYSVDNLEEKLKYNISNETEEINQIIQLKNGELACCGYEKIKIINFDIYNNNIITNSIINEKNNIFFSLIELSNNYLISSCSSNKIQFWNKNINNSYKCIHSIDDIEINLLYNIDNFSFVGYSNTNKKLKKYLISVNKEINPQSELNDIFINLNKKCVMINEDYLLINFEDKNKFGTIVININKFEILSKIVNDTPLYFINNYISDKIITTNENGLIQKWNFSKEDTILYEYDSIKINNNSITKDEINSIFEINKKKLLFVYQNKIKLYSKNALFS